MPLGAPVSAASVTVHLLVAALVSAASVAIHLLIAAPVA